MARTSTGTRPVQGRHTGFQAVFDGTVSVTPNTRAFWDNSAGPAAADLTVTLQHNLNAVYPGALSIEVSDFSEFPLRGWAAIPNAGDPANAIDLTMQDTPPMLTISATVRLEKLY